MMMRWSLLLLYLVLLGPSLSAQVLTRDSLALVSFYQDTFGDNWINNEGWLESSVGQWYGVGLDPGGQVISLKLPANGLQGQIGNSIEDMVSLHVLDVSDNEITGLPTIFTQMEISAVDVGHNKLNSLPDYSSVNRTFSLFVNNNHLDFSDLEQNASLPGLVYTPQQDSVIPQVLTTALGQPVQLSASLPGTFNVYQWFLDGTPVGQDNAQLDLQALEFDELGVYHCTVSNELLPALQLTGSVIEIAVPTTISGTVLDNLGQPAEAQIRVYRKIGSAYQHIDTFQNTSGSFAYDLNMGTYLIKVIPLSPSLLPQYLGGTSAYWLNAQDLPLDGNQATLNLILNEKPISDGAGIIEGQLSPLLELSDILLYQMVDGQQQLMDHHVISGETFTFQGLPPGDYRVIGDLPGVTGLEVDLSLSDGQTIQIRLQTPEELLLPDQSVARQWNEVLLEAIRRDFARPTVHARNLFHLSAAQYDIWAVFNPPAQTFLLGNRRGSFDSFFEPFPWSGEQKMLVEEAISYAAFRILSHRFASSPNAAVTLEEISSLFTSMGYDPQYTSTDYSTGDAAALGNFVAQTYIEFGFQDGANEQNEYQNKHYQTLNPPLVPAFPGNPGIIDLNRWQPLSLEVFIDQAGNVIPRNTPEFLSPEWGQVSAFSLDKDQANMYPVDDFTYQVYHDPGAPPLAKSDEGLEQYQWGFALVSIWSAHLDPSDGVMWDISPASKGNNPKFPINFEDYHQFYNLIDGGDPGMGYDLNPVTQQPYEPHLVPRGDYTRVIAEYWADGPDSETPPGHWFTLLNYINDHPLSEKRFEGQGASLDALEWDIKAYFTLGGAMHDAAVTAWGIKGYYDYLRPISALRAMADLGQSSNPDDPSFHPQGIPLVPGYIELVDANDPLVGQDQEHLGKIKVLAWRGPDFIINPENFAADVDWILAENWWPYQRPTFVTPPFAGYVSGHSTFSRAAAEVLTLLTGSAYFPGGLGSFTAVKDEFLVFEEGPSVDITLQWATYRDASDETSLSRIWGGIHPPADDLPGRIIGERIGIDAFNYAKSYFAGSAVTEKTQNIDQLFLAYPVPAQQSLTVQLAQPGQEVDIRILDLNGKLAAHIQHSFPAFERTLEIPTHNLSSGMYFLVLRTSDQQALQKIAIR